MVLLAAVLLGLLTMHATPAMAMPSPSAGPGAMAMLAMQQHPLHDDHGQRHLVSPCVSSPVRPAATGPIPPGTAPTASHVPAARPSTAPAGRQLRPAYLKHADPQDLGICRT
jgi:hypothetical protein